MGIIVERKNGIETVGEMIAALQEFPLDMPIEVEMSHYAQVYRVEPQEDECVDDPRGRVCIDGGDEV